LRQGSLFNSIGYRSISNAAENAFGSRESCCVWRFSSWRRLKLKSLVNCPTIQQPSRHVSMSQTMRLRSGSDGWIANVINSYAFPGHAPPLPSFVTAKLLVMAGRANRAVNPHL